MRRATVRGGVEGMMKKYDKIRYPSFHPWMEERDNLHVTVKYDGSNGRLGVVDGKLYIGTRSSAVPVESVDKLPHGLGKHLAPLARKASGMHDDLVHMIGEGNVIFFEICGAGNLHKILYPWDMKYIAFDGWFGGRYVPPEDARAWTIIETLGMDVVERLPFTTVKEAKEWVEKQDHAKIEGVVCKDYETQVFVKYIHPKNSELASAIFAAPKSSPHYHESAMVHATCTPNRVEKVLKRVAIITGLEGKKLIGPALQALWDELVEEVLPAHVKEKRPPRLDLERARKMLPKVAVPAIKKAIGEW